MNAAIPNFPGGNANTDVTIRKGGTTTESAKITYYTGDKATMLNAVAGAISAAQANDTASVTGDKISIATAQGVTFAVTIGSSLS